MFTLFSFVLLNNFCIFRLTCFFHHAKRGLLSLNGFNEIFSVRSMSFSLFAEQGLLFQPQDILQKEVIKIFV